jgi:transcriptional antiterminator NusG
MSEDLKDREPQAGTPAPPAAETPSAPATPPAPVAPPAEPPQLAATPQPPELAKPVQAPRLVEPPKVVELPKAPEPPKALETPQPVELPKPVEAPQPVEAPKPVAPPIQPTMAGESLAEDSRPEDMKWYVVTTYSGFESKAKQALEERIKKSPIENLFGEVLVPTEAPPEGKKKSAGRSFFPGYIFVQMVMNETTWTLVKGTPRVTNFVGNQKPTPVPPEQIAEIHRQISEGAIKAKPEVMFGEGDRIRVSQGPFQNMTGTVSSINPVKQVVRVLVSIFGRATPVELEYHQVEKLP